MDAFSIRALLARVAAGDASVDDAVNKLRDLPFEQVGDTALVDHHRSLRTGIPEVVFGQTKTAKQIADIMRALAAQGGGALATRVDVKKAERVVAALPEVTHHAAARALVIEPTLAREDRGTGIVAVVSAGTSDEPVAAEVALVLDYLGHATERIRDVGVAGIHRVLGKTSQLRAASVVIVCAGMEGALPSVIAGLIDRPVIAVPTSVGYGVSAGGFAALFGMLSSCAAGVTVVNIDNGFGAAVAAARMNECCRSARSVTSESDA